MRPSASDPGFAYQPPLPWGAETDAAPSTAELRAWLDAEGPQHLSDMEALELLLSSATRGARAVAAALIVEFGSLPEVLGAGPCDLARVAPAGAVRAVRLARDLGRRMLAAPLHERAVLSSSSALHAYLRGVLTGVAREQFRVLFLDRRNRLIADELMGEGTTDHAPVYPREVVRRALERNASALILAHNHPSGDPTPSSADIEMTRQVVEACRALRLAVHDHVVVGGQDTVSLRALGVMA
jgi:DNA repair protein RadC